MPGVWWLKGRKMPTYFRFGLGPFRFSQRLGRTQARKRAAARGRGQRQQAAATAREQRARQREFTRTHTEAVEYVRTDQEADSLIGVFRRENLTDHDLHLGLLQGPLPVPEGTWLTVTYSSGNLLEVAPAEVPAAVAARRAARADHAARTHRAVISGCRIDGVKGGSFDVEAEGRDTVHITVQPDTALRFLSLKNGDIVQVTLGPDNSGLEEFWHLRRANGATPRNPASFGPGELTSRPGT
jgi:hypothetical protein